MRHIGYRKKTLKIITKSLLTVQVNTTNARKRIIDMKKLKVILELLGLNDRNKK